VAIRPSAAAPPGPCCPTPVASTDTYATVRDAYPGPSRAVKNACTRAVGAAQYGNGTRPRIDSTPCPPRRFEQRGLNLTPDAEVRMAPVVFRRGGAAARTPLAVAIPGQLYL